MKKLLLVAALALIAWAVLLNDWTVSWDGHYCTYQARVLICSTMHAPEYKFGRPGKFDQTPEESYRERYNNFYSKPL